MDDQFCLHEKSRCELSDSNDHIPKITFREAELEKDLFYLGQLYWQFCFDVNGEDVATLKEFDLDGSKVQITEAEARLYAFLNAGCKIQVAFVNNVMAGFLLYSNLFENIISIRSCFVESWALELKLGKGLINSLQSKPKNLIFQTRKATPPDKLLKVTPIRTKIAEDEHFLTWSMPWG